MYLFSARNHGTVAVKQIQGSPGIVMFLSDFPQHESVIITSIGYSQAVNVQFSPSLADLVYLYVFGDNMGRVTITGLCFDHTCNDVTAMQGVNRTLSYYRDNRAAVRNQALQVQLGKTQINGFITNLVLDTASAEFKTMNFRLDIMALPRAADRSTIDAAAKEQALKDQAALDLETQRIKHEQASRIEAVKINNSAFGELPEQVQTKIRQYNPNLEDVKQQGDLLNLHAPPGIPMNAGAGQKFDAGLAMGLA